MNITDVKIFEVTGCGNLKASASITLDEEIVIRNIKIIDGQKGLFVGMPSVKKTNGDFIDVAFPITAEAREELTGVILEAYEENQAAKKPAKAPAKKTYAKK